MPMVHWPEVTCTYENLQAHCSLQMLSVHLVQLTVTSLQTKQISLLHMKKKLVVTIQISLVNTVLKYKMQFRKVSGLEIKRIAPLHGPIWRTPETIQLHLAQILALVQLYS